MAGDLPPAGRPRASLTRVAARLTTPLAYLAVLGGLQVLLLWTLRDHVGVWVAAASTAGVLVLLGLLVFVEGRGRLKLICAGALGALTAIGPTLYGVVERTRVGLTMEHDGLLQIESAIDRLLNRQPIYGVDWSTTPMARISWDVTAGPNPALHHLAYFPLTVLVGVPFRVLTHALGLPFDYRIVLIGFTIVGLLAIVALPIAPDRRVMVITALFVSPLVTLYLWSGRTDIEFLALVLLSLALLSRGHPIPAAASRLASPTPIARSPSRSFSASGRSGLGALLRRPPGRPCAWLPDGARAPDLGARIDTAASTRQYDPLAMAGVRHRDGVRADRAADPGGRPGEPAGQRLQRLRRHCSRCLRLPGDVARRLARRLVLPSRLYLGIGARDSFVSLVSLAGTPCGLGRRSLALSRRAVGGRGCPAGRGVAARRGVLRATPAAPLGFRALHPGWRRRCAAAARCSSRSVDHACHRDDVAGEQRCRLDLDGATPALGAGPDVLGDGGRAAAAPACPAVVAGEWHAGRRRAATGLSATGVAGGRRHRA